ncbi:MAG TPA: hypothetical protein VE913_20090 [Longimicrobium sp.]|nr:hypothetical protein [Longimicrobium sp.]
MTELQLLHPPHYPALHRASRTLWTMALAGSCIGFAIMGAVEIGWIAGVPWLVSLFRAGVACTLLGGALEHLSMVRPDSVTRRMHRTGAVLLPALLATVEWIPVNSALAAFLAFGVAYTIDTSTGFPAWSRERWMAAAGSMGFVVYLAGVAGPEHPLSWIAIAASLPLLVLAIYAGMRLHEVEKARYEDGAHDADPAALTGAAPQGSV